LVSPDPATHLLFSPNASYRTSRLPSATNNNKTVKPPPYLVQYSRKRASNTLPPLGPGSPRSRRGRVRTVPSSRANSSKQSRVDPSESSGGQSKRSRSASEEPWDSSSTAAVSGQLEIRGSESQIHREAEPYSSPSHHSNSSPSHHSNRPRRLTKVETVRVLRARSALLLPLPPPPLPPHPSLAGGYPSLSHPSLSSTPLVLKSEDRKKKRR